MLTNLRKLFGGILGFLLIGLLVIAFAAWGVADMFTGVARGSIATVGNQNITAGEFRSRLSRQLDDMSRELNEPITLEQAKALGIDRQVLSRMITLSTLDAASEDIGLAISEKIIGQQIVTDQMFAGPTGDFDTATFRRILAINGLNEKLFIRDRQNNERREQMLDAVAASAVFPKPLNKIIFEHMLESRVAEYILLQPDAAGIVNEPSDEELLSFYQQAPNIFTEPERRSVSVLTLAPDRLLDTVTVSDSEMRDEYEGMMDTYVKAETRMVNQLVLATDEEAEKATALIGEGKSFDAIVKALGQTLDSTDLGEMSRGDFIAEELADIAFTLEAGKMSDVIDGPLGKIIMRVSAINQESVQPFEELEDEIRARLARQKATDELIVFSEQIYDARAEGASLEAIANQYELELARLESVAIDGTLEDGTVPELVKTYDELATQIFNAEMNANEPAIETVNGSYLWIRIDGIRTERVSPFEEVREKAALQWKSRERRALLEGLAEHLVSQGSEGKSFSDLADSLGKTPIKSPAINRNTDNETFSRDAVRKLFSTNEDGYAWGRVGFGESLIVMRVAEVIKPDSDNELLLNAYLGAEQQRINEEVISQFIVALQDEYGVTIDFQTLDAQIGTQQQ